MKKLFKKTFYFCLILTSLTDCQDLKEGLTGKKKSNSDEFLIEKKNPLVLPPKFDELPEPKKLTKDNQNEQEEIDLKAILTNKNSKNKTLTKSQTSTGSLEQSTLEKIKSN